MGSAVAAAGLPSQLRSPSRAPFLVTVKEQRVGGCAPESPPSLCLWSESQTRASTSRARTPASALLLPLSPSSEFLEISAAQGFLSLLTLFFLPLPETITAVFYMPKLSPPST